MDPVDTIAAVATAPGRGGIGIVRVSGPRVAAIAEAISGTLPVARQAVFRRFRDQDGTVLDEGLVLLFPAPGSYTGEDVLELHGHGGPVVLDSLLERVCTLGARLARPGEFTERAFLNERLDLAQAEAVADLIDAASREAARAAVASLEGALSVPVQALAEALTELRMHVEAAIDFPEEEIDFLGDPVISRRLAELHAALADLMARAGQGRLLRDGMRVVIAGRPNAGKSSLLNALAGAESAIVTEIPGTTRDVLRERILIDGMPVHVIDTAGLRDSDDPVEREGVRRAWAEIAAADRVLLVIDHAVGEQAEDAAILGRLPDGVPVTRVYNKIDRTGHAPGHMSATAGDSVYLAARTGTGVDALRTHLGQCMGLEAAGEGVFSARRRHLDALRRTDACLQRAASELEAGAGELVAEELRLAADALGEITGRITADELLGRIFAGFCIGK